MLPPRSFSLVPHQCCNAPEKTRPMSNEKYQVKSYGFILRRELDVTVELAAILHLDAPVSDRLSINKKSGGGGGQQHAHTRTSSSQTMDGPSIDTVPVNDREERGGQSACAWTYSRRQTMNVTKKTHRNACESHVPDGSSKTGRWRSSDWVGFACCSF